MKNKKQIMIIIAACALIAGIFLFLSLPIFRKYRSIRSQRDLIQLMVSDAAEKGDKLPHLRNQLMTMRSKLQLKHSVIPEQVELGQFLQTIASLMNQYDLREQFVKPGNERKIDQLWAVPIDIHCKGQLTQMFNFFSSLRELDRMIRIEQVVLSNSPDMDGQLNMETKAVIYYKAQKAKS
jgi:Tfp pilus assembly protein PilO